MVTGFDLLHDNKPLQKHWIRRVIAYIIDFGISSVLIYVVFVFTFALAPNINMLWYFPMTAGMVQVFYSAVFEYVAGKTIGKMLLGLEVEPLTQTFDMSEALIRNVSKLYGILLLLDWLGGMLSEGDPRQRYLDRFSETTVRAIGEPIHVGEFLDDHLFREEEQREDEKEEEEEETKRCRECNGELVTIGEERYRCRDCGRIQ
ncbi:MAG: RDD family protein [Candidatus Thermoplasmatota archaeon]